MNLNKQTGCSRMHEYMRHICAASLHAISSMFFQPSVLTFSFVPDEKKVTILIWGFAYTNEDCSEYQGTKQMFGN